MFHELSTTSHSILPKREAILEQKAQSREIFKEDNFGTSELVFGMFFLFPFFEN